MLQAKGRDTQSDQNKYTHGDRILEAGTCAKDTAAGRASESWDEEAQAACGRQVPTCVCPWVTDGGEAEPQPRG